MPGKNPHRPEGKADTDNEHMQAAWMSKGAPHDAGRNDKARAELDQQMMERGGGPTSFPAEEQIGGSRPGVESRVKEAIERREDREE
ncbi:MAG TPA: hypothetical protein VFH78_02800 [Candidatus Thermoplasmatota archaeon]|nr:hypothetical protein [Candidatus Thermoplasmatota archaeon]